MTRMFLRAIRSRLLAFALVMTLANTGCWKEKKVETWSSATGPEAFERLFWGSVQQKDWKEVRNRLAPGFMGLHRNQIFDRDAAIARFQKIQLEQVSIGNVEVRPAGAEMVVSSEITAVSTESQGSLRWERVKVLTVWQQVKHGWIVIAQSDYAP